MIQDLGLNLDGGGGMPLGRLVIVFCEGEGERKKKNLYNRLFFRKEIDRQVSITLKAFKPFSLFKYTQKLNK